MMNNNFIPNMMTNNNTNFNQNMMINNSKFFPANNFQMNNMMINPNNFMQNNINMSNNIPQMNNNMVNYMISKEDEEWMKGFHMGVEKEMNSKPKIRVIFNTIKVHQQLLLFPLEQQLINFWKNILNILKDLI